MQTVFKSQQSLFKHFRTQLVTLLILICLIPIAPYIRRNFGGEDKNFAFKWVLIVIILVILPNIVYKFIETIQFDYTSKCLKVIYYILFFIKKKRVIKFNSILYKHKTIVSNLNKKDSITILENNKKCFTILEGEDGWNREKIEDIKKHLEQITSANKKANTNDL